MRERISTNALEKNFDEMAAEILRAREVKIPKTINELRQATESSNIPVEQILGNFDRIHTMKEMGTDDHGKDIQPESYETWLDATLDLDIAFFEESEGTLGLQLIELTELNDAAFANRKADVLRLSQQTSNIALRMYRYR